MRLRKLLIETSMTLQHFAASAAPTSKTGVDTVIRMRPGGYPAANESMLLVRVGRVRCALPIASVIETMRPQPIEPIAGAPAFIAGLAVVRGQPVPVVDTAALLGHAGNPTRFLTVRAGPRMVALAVDEVIGVRGIARSRFDRLPPLLREVGPAVIALERLDAELLVVLDASRLIPEDMLATLERGPA